MFSHNPGHHNHRHNTDSSHHGNHHHRHSSGPNHHHRHNQHRREDSSQGQRESVKDVLGNILGGLLDEANYQAEKNRLTMSIESLKSQALEQDAQHNYRAAIMLYDAALREANALNHIWIRHQWHLGYRNNYATCSSHTQYISEISTLRGIVVNKQQAELQEAQRLRKIEEDKELEARRLREAEEARQREVQAAQDWQARRGTIPYQELLKRAANAGLEQAELILKDLNPIYSSYDRSRKYHDDKDRDVLLKLSSEKTRFDSLLFQEQQRKRLLEEAEADNQRQNAIHQAMYGVLNELNTGNVPAALKSLSDIVESAKKIHNIENIQNQSRTPVSVFNSSLEELKKLQQEFYNDANNEVIKFAQHVTRLVRGDMTSPKPGKAVLYSSYEQGLEDIIKKHLKENWKKFNARDKPQDLIDAIVKKIVERLKLIGNKRFMADVLTFTRWPNMSIEGYDALLLEIAGLIDKYVSLNPPQLNKPNLDSLLQPYMQMQNSTSAIVAEHVDDIPKGTYVDYEQKPKGGLLEYNLT